MPQSNAYERLLLSVPTWNFLGQRSGSEERRTTGQILIVDSEQVHRVALSKAIEEAGYDVIEAGSTSDAIAAVSVNHVDLVLADLRAPELGGLEFCRMLKKAAATRFLPVFVTAQIDDLDTEVLAFEAGADEFVVAPLQRLRAFRARIQASLRHKAMIDSLDDSETVLFSLAESVEERDSALGQHCQRLALMASAMGLALGLPPNQIMDLQRAGYLHDVGKVAIPDSILFKPGPLTGEEWEIMQSHTERGVRICSRMRSLEPVLPVIRHHHEKWDGSGYPGGLRGEEIPLLARIIQLADIYDALTTNRPYKRAFTPNDALAIIRDETAKGWRDPDLVERFADLLPMFRTPSSPSDHSQLSLHALAASVDRYRRSSSPLKEASGDTKLSLTF
jgi:putative two-component system response regulator